MKIAIDQIHVDEQARIRQDVGDLRSLEDSIRKVGLINPVLIDEQHNLVAGFRRLSACKNLGMEEVEAKVVTFDDDKMKLLEVEAAENFFRKDFTPEEVLAVEKRRQEIIESTRKKGVFERAWLGFKRLFGKKPAEQETKPPQQTKVDEQPQQPAEPAPRKEQNPQPAETVANQPGQAQETRSATEQQPMETVQVDDAHSIKWRTS